MFKEKDAKITPNVPIHSSEKIELVHSGEDFFNRLLCLISEAKFTIHLQTYIFENDATGTEVANALKEAAYRDVEVYVLLDGYGSSSLPYYFINDLKSSRVNIRFFAPFFSLNSIYIGRRLHHKVAVSDEKITLIGGINIADKYRGFTIEKPWLDYAIQITDYKITSYVQQVCEKIYFKKSKESILKTKTTFNLSEKDSIHIIQNDWLHKKNEIYNAYSYAIKNAKHEIIILGSYFFPGKKFIKELQEAALNGVKVRLILSGITDIPMIGRATCYLYTSFLKHNVELFEWNNSVLHGKVAIVDNEWATIGSFNLNHLSSYGSIELNVETKSQKFNKVLTSNLNSVLSQCEKISYNTIKMRKGMFNKLLNWLAYQLVRILLILTTYLPYKRILKRYQNE